MHGLHPRFGGARVPIMMVVFPDIVLRLVRL
jgi:hypothetical protein